MLVVSEQVMGISRRECTVDDNHLHECVVIIQRVLDTVGHRKTSKVVWQRDYHWSLLACSIKYLIEHVAHYTRTHRVLRKHNVMVTGPI